MRRFITYLTFLCFVLIPTSAFAQYHANPTQKGNNYKCYQWNKPRNWGSMRSIGNSKLTISYDYTYCVEADSTGTKLKDSYLLQIGDEVNRYFSEYSQRVDSMAFNYLMSLKQEHIDALTPEWTPSRLSRTLYSWIPDKVCPLYNDVYTYNESRELVVSSRFQYVEYRYSEPIAKFDWEILPDRQTILGYECNKAQTTFRGRTWTVWFTFDIPYSTGPWKFGGLPGLILMAEDEYGLFKWIADGIMQKEDDPIVEFIEGYSSDKRIYSWIPNKKVKNCTRREMESMWKRFWNAPLTIRSLEQQEDTFLDDEDREFTVRVVDPVPDEYYPRLELDI